MPLQVIGAGWGRTGTESLEAALEILGFGRCYRMFELLESPRQVVIFEKLARGERPGVFNEGEFESLKRKALLPAV